MNSDELLEVLDDHQIEVEALRERVAELERRKRCEPPANMCSADDPCSACLPRALEWHREQGYAACEADVRAHLRGGGDWMRLLDSDEHRGAAARKDGECSNPECTFTDAGASYWCPTCGAVGIRKGECP